jgi:hypothetical protein
MKTVGFTCGVAVLATVFGVGALAQPRPPVPLPDVSQPQNGKEPHRTRLILKDGSYQLVMSYQLKGKVVSYVSAERGEREELPADLVDWDATHKWEKQHTLTADGQAPAPEIDPELLKEEEERRTLNPEVEKDLSLPDQVAVVALDYYQGTPELVPLVQSDGDLNRVTGHSILKLSINPRSASHEILSLKGVESNVQMHVAQPVIYLRVGDDAGVSRGGGAPLTVNTFGANVGEKTSDRPPDTHAYVMVRADVRTDARVLASFNVSSLGASRPQRDVVETTSELLPGGHWMKITPKQPLDFGEYALMEVLSDRDVNSAVWDFGVHPTAAENRDVIKPQPKRPVTLEHR